METSARPYVLAETNYKTVKDSEYRVAILPWGATEAHNYHLPYATDSILSESAAIEAARIAWEDGAKVMVLPNLPFGVNTGQLDVPFCMNMNPSTQPAVLRDIVNVLDRNKVHKLVIVNGHGGNHFKQMIRELYLEFPNVFICALNWWQAENTKNYFEEPGDHAGALETSVIMHLTPELVLALDQAGNVKAKKFKLKALQEGWVTAQRKWTSVTVDTGVGNPKSASKKKGEHFFKGVTKKIASFLKELDDADLDNLYE
ncbi:creatininase family protein [Aestuariibaculum sediminum]|uniref:Creatininase family protein n=1 Tax=Aestuariibaculum sediminum TaxID=2770637 RepID=A0A8J6Q234_9FLAO|nr:creatininase family protein [Aestuariibaculum sediminum]MBD0831604.1 creatininase family protein [Aestuariibaculum sediminum]